MTNARILVASLLAATFVATGTPSAQQATPATPRRTRPAAAAPAQVVVRDRSGAPLEGVRVVVTGVPALETTTGADGTATLSNVGSGSFRLRLERDGFITLEREVTVRSGQPAKIEVALSAAPAPPPPPPEPAPAPAPAPPSTVAASPSGPPVFISIPDFLDKNYIGRDPLKESVLGCLADSTTRLLQLHDAIGEHNHADLDEMLYVVAGEGSVRVRGESRNVAAGALSIIPHGQPHAIERRGKNPLMVLSILSGAPCSRQSTVISR